MDREELHNKAKALRQQIGSKANALGKKIARKGRKFGVSFLLMTTFLSGPSSQVFAKTDHTDDKKKTTQTTDAQKKAFDAFLMEYTNETFQMSEEERQHVISQIAEQKTQELQDQIVANVAELQDIVKKAKSNGTRVSTVAKIFSKVSPARISGTNNYCVAGATCAYENIDDPLMQMILGNIIADNTKTAGQLQVRSGHPNLSCHAFREFYKKTLGQNYADRNSPHFRQTLQNLKPGDIIILSSQQNTSSGMHCVTFEKYDDTGRICVKSLNRESNYSVSSGKILAVAQIPNQFHKLLQEELERNPQLLDQLMQQDSRFAFAERLPPKTFNGLLAMAETQGSLLQKQR